MTNFRKEFERVRWEVVLGNAHLDIWEGLSKRLFSDDKRMVVNTAPTFFGMTLESHINSAVMYAAKLFDTTQNSMSLWTILRSASKHRASLSANASNALKAHFRESRARRKTVKSGLNAVQIRRNKMLAHLDAAVVSNPEQIVKDSQITVQELRNIFVVAWEICNGISAAYWDVSASLKLMDSDDFEHPLTLIESAKRRQIAEYESEFGPLPE